MIMGLSEVLHKIVDVAAGVGQRQDLHDEIDDLDEAPAVEAAPEPPSEAAPVEDAASPEPSEPVAALAEAAPVDVQEPVQVHVQEDGSSGEADA